MQKAVGKRCYYNGKVYEIVGENGANYILWNPNGSDKGHWYAYEVSKKAVEPVADTLFNVGDIVRSEYSFKGKVVAFDYTKNEVICISLSDNPKGGGRARWSYKPRELEKIAVFCFELNKTYKFKYHGRIIHVRAMECVFNNSLVQLYHVDSGKFFRAINKYTDLDTLSIFGLEPVK